jgi:polyhydroxyalkanoate synthesis regulator protein
MINLRKYATNRRLYVTKGQGIQPNYVTLATVHGYLLEGNEVRVIHEKDGQDITHEVLLEILKKHTLKQWSVPQLMALIVKGAA